MASAAQIEIVVRKFQLVQCLDDSNLAAAEFVLLDRVVEKPVEGFNQVACEFRQLRRARNLGCLGDHEVGRITE
jgi:hypothetical protein